VIAYVDEIELPSVRGWDYGGLPFGLEPLLLPPVWSVPHGRIGIVLESWSWQPSPKELDAARAHDPDLLLRMFWFRWITGHQTTFILWQLLAVALATPRAGDQCEAARRARILVRGCSLMLLYAGSSPLATYSSTIRPIMALQHPHLSGSWAPDFRAVRAALRGRIPFEDGPQTRALLSECELNRRIHRCIGQKLVPNGPSLLQTAPPGDMRGWRSDMLSILYDSTFMTIRTTISYETIIVQLLRRLRAIGLDVATNGLYPTDASSEQEEPPEMKVAAIAVCKNTFLSDLDVIVEAAMVMVDKPPTEDGSEV